MSTIFESATEIWAEAMAKESLRPWSRRLASGEMGLPHYKGFLIETYHNAGLNPQLQGYASLFVKDRPRDMFKKFFQHAISELGHDLLALSDLEVLGVNKEFVLATRPLPQTSAFFANAVFNIQKFGAVSYLAYLFHLEYTPTKNGPAIMAMLENKGIPKNALTFLEEHSTVDINHLKLMKSYMDALFNEPSDYEIFANCLRDYVILHSRLLESAYENGELLFGSKVA